MPATPPQTQESGRNVDQRTVFVAGGAAGLLGTPSGSILPGDEIQSVARFTTATFAPGTDLTSQFVSPVVVADQINNTGGTSTAGQLLLVTYYRRNARL